MAIWWFQDGGFLPSGIVRVWNFLYSIVITVFLNFASSCTAVWILDACWHTKTVWTKQLHRRIGQSVLFHKKQRFQYGIHLPSWIYMHVYRHRCLSVTASSVAFCPSSSSIVPQYFCCPVVSCGLQHIPANKWLSSNLTWNLESLGFSSRAALVNLVADGVVYVSGLGVRAQVLKNIVHLAWYQYDSIGHRLGWKKAIITFYSIFFFTKYQPNYRLLCSHALQDQHLWLVIGPMFIMTSSAHCLDLNFHHYCWQLCVPFYQMFLVSFDSWTHGIWGTLYRNCNFFWMQEHFSLHCLLSDTCDTNARITYCSKSIQYSVYRSVIGYFQ